MKIRYFLVLALMGLLSNSCSPDAIANDSSISSDAYATGGEHSVYPDNVRD